MQCEQWRRTRARMPGRLSEPVRECLRQKKPTRGASRLKGLLTNWTIAADSESRAADCQQFESVLRELHTAGFWPTDELVSATGFAFHQLS